LKKDDKFGLYRKSINNNSPDEFVVLDTNSFLRNNSSPNWQRREQFIQSVREVEKSRADCEKLQKDTEKQRQLLDNNFEGEDYIAFNFRKNERGEWVSEKENHYSTPKKGQEIREGWGYDFTGQLFKDFADKGIMGFSKKK